MRAHAWRLFAALLIGGLLSACSQFKQLHQEHQDIQDQVKAARKELADVQKAIDYGVAISALKHSIPGDFAWVTREEVEGLLKGGGLRISR